ncbi:Hypothetical predicted protein [Podarcis lilfordi]|uniref:Uncharacterized protein n=1 Tax=Podarcis lilfordi TaxID=74358 RepID=A0AA35PA52_9SAUR|nr:Hypothetical predicted protein [Podarcis lilfordi]
MPRQRVDPRDAASLRAAAYADGAPCRELSVRLLRSGEGSGNAARSPGRAHARAGTGRESQAEAADG